MPCLGQYVSGFEIIILEAVRIKGTLRLEVNYPLQIELMFFLLEMALNFSRSDYLRLFGFLERREERNPSGILAEEIFLKMIFVALRGSKSLYLT
jgi:hypothetical protein